MAFIEEVFGSSRVLLSLGIYGMGALVYGLFFLLLGKIPGEGNDVASQCQRSKIPMQYLFKLSAP